MNFLREFEQAIGKLSGAFAWRVDVFYARMTPRRKAVVDIFDTTVFVIPMCSLILYSSYDFVSYSYQIQEISSDSGGLSYRFAFRALLPLGYCLVMIQSFAVISCNVGLLAGDDDPSFLNQYLHHTEKL